MTLYNSTNGLKIQTNNNSSNNYSLDLQNNAGSLLYVQNNGDIGIGTSSPSFKLDVMGDARVSTDIHIGWHIKHDSDDSYFGFTDNDTIIFATSNTERVRINSSGNVGIGTQPQCKLDVKSTDTLSDEILLNLKTEANSSGKSYTSLKLEKGTGYGGLIKGYIHQGVGSGLEFSTLNGNSENIAMTIMDSGNIGIGETSPGHKLHVNGDVKCGKINIDGSSLNDDDYLYILQAPRPGTNSEGVAHFINGANRTADGGVNTYTIRNNSGNLKLGKSGTTTIIDGDIRLHGEADSKTVIKAYNSTDNSDIAGLVPGTTGGTLIEVQESSHLVVGLRGNDNLDSFTILSSGTSHPPSAPYTHNVATFQSNGYVGIGTDSPSRRLEIHVPPITSTSDSESDTAILIKGNGPEHTYGASLVKGPSIDFWGPNWYGRNIWTC